MEGGSDQEASQEMRLDYAYYLPYMANNQVYMQIISLPLRLAVARTTVVHVCPLHVNT
jgi:hypothetical protein